MGLFKKKENTTQSNHSNLRQLVMNEVMFDATLRGKITLSKDTDMLNQFELIDENNLSFNITNHGGSTSRLIDFKMLDIGEVIAESFCNIKIVRNIERYGIFSIGLIVNCDDKVKYRAVWKREDKVDTYQVRIVHKSKGVEDDEFVICWGIIPGYDYTQFGFEDIEKDIRENKPWIGDKI